MIGKLTKTVKWVLGITGGLALAIFGNMLDRYLEWNIYPEKVTNAFAWTWKQISHFFAYNVPMWMVLILLLVVSIAWLFYVRYSVLTALKPYIPSTDDSNFLSYTEDTFGVEKTKWAWHYEGGTIKDLAPVCPYCETSTTINHFNSNMYGVKTSAECSRCRLESRPYTVTANQSYQDVGQEILRRIDADEYQK